MSTKNIMVCSFAVTLVSCSAYPIPENVGPFKTEQIVRFGRCEMRSALLDYMSDHGIIRRPIVETEIEAQIKAATTMLKDRKKVSQENVELVRLTKVAVVYSFDFDITENNNANAAVGLRLPSVSNVLDVGASGALNLTRQGSRSFTAEDNWHDLITNSDLCKDTTPYQESIIYPLTGSIGVGAVVTTFIDIDKQGGAKDSFVDTLTFTTSVGGSANAAVKLDPIPQRFRPVSATAAFSASRLDIHKLTISLVFPRSDPPNPIKGVTRVDGDLNAPFTRPANWRARYNLCVADARAREDAFKSLRLEAPEVYCIRYADAFAPQTGLISERRRTSKRPEKAGPDKIIEFSYRPEAVKPVPPVPALGPTPLIRPNSKL